MSRNALLDLHSEIILPSVLYVICFDELEMPRIWINPITDTVALNDSMADGLLFSFLCQLLTRNSFLLYWRPMFGALVGLAGVFCFMHITKQSFIFSIHGLLKTQTLCTCCLVYLKLKYRDKIQSHASFNFVRRLG